MNNEQKKTILLVEDEVITAASEKLLLEKYGYTVVIAHSGELAVEAMKKTPRIDLLLMDIDLGDGIDGTDAAEIILKDHDIPVVFLSSHTEPVIVEKTEKITSYGYVVKNSSVTVLDAAIKMAFKLFDANKKLKEAKNTLEATLDALPDLLFEVGLDGCLYDYHSPQTQLLLSPAAGLIGKKLPDILPSVIAKTIMTGIDEANEKVYSTGKQFQIDVPSGTQWFEISVTRKAGFEKAPHFIILSRNITKRKRAEEDLHTHQIELEMQNEELRGKQNEIDALREKYFNLYDLAPVSYFTLSDNGSILEANLTAAALLGLERKALDKVPFTKFIFSQDQDIYYLYQNQLHTAVQTTVPLFCELRMQHADGTVFPVHMVLTVTPDAAPDAEHNADTSLYRIVVMKNI